MKTAGSPSAGHPICRIIDRCFRERREFAFCSGFSWRSLTASSQAQPQADVNTPAERAAYVEQLTAESEAAKAEAELWALENDMPVYDNDGYNTRELMGILDGRPVYYTTETCSRRPPWRRTASGTCRCGT